MPSIRQLPSGKWFADFYLGVKGARRRHRAVVEARSKTEAKIKLAQVVAAEVAKHGGRVRMRNRAQNLSAVFQLWMQDGKRNGTCVTRVLHFIAFLGDPIISDVEPGDLMDWADDRRRSVSPATVRRDLSSVSGFFAWAVRGMLAPMNPAKLIQRPRFTYRRPDAPSSERVRKVLDAVRTHPILGPTYFLAAFAALRRSEIARLEWFAVDFNTPWRDSDVTGSIAVPGQKTDGAAARIPLLPELRAFLESKTKRSGRVLAGRDGHGVAPNAISLAVARWNAAYRETCAAIKEGRKQPRLARHVELPNPHSLRHFCATEMLAARVPLVAVSKFLRHSSSRATEMIYGHHQAMDFGADLARGMSAAMATERRRNV